MSCDFNGQTSKDDDLSIMFSEAMDWQSVATNSSEEVVIYPVNGGHRAGSSQIKVKNIVDSSWDKKFHWGNLVATHYKGQYFAYALTVPGKSAGMVRVIRSGSTDRILLKGFHGFVRDLSFAFHEKRILVAAVDEYSYLLVHEIVGSNAQLILQVNPDGITTSSDCHRVVWCPYVPESPKSLEEADVLRNDADDHALMLAASHDCRVEIWHLGHISGTVTYPTVSTGSTQITLFDDAVVDVAFSPDSTAIAVASLDGYVRFFLVNTRKESPKILHKWMPHEGKRLSGIIFLDNLSHPNIRECSLWKWAVTSAENNTEFKLWSCELWKCHQTIRFKSADTTPIVQKMTLDLSASFLLISDIDRKALYVMHIEQEERHVASDDEDESSKTEDRTVSKVSSITQLLLPFSAISVAIREAAIKPSSQPLGGADEDFEGDEKASKVIMKMLVVQPKSLQKCKAVFELGTSVPLGEGAGTSFSTVNTTSEYEPMNVLKPSATNHISLLTPDAFVSPAKTNTETPNQPMVASPVSVSPLPPAPNEILALSSPRRPTPEVTSSTTPKRNGIPSGGSSPSREVEEILGTRPMTEGSIESPDTSSATVPTGAALSDAISAYPISLSPAMVRTVSANSKGSSPVMDKFNAPSVEDPLCTYPTSAVAAPPPPSVPDLNGSLLEIFKEALVVENANAQSLSQAWPTVLPSHNVQPPQRPKEPAAVREMDVGNGTSSQLQMMQQSLDQLVQLVSAQRIEQQQLKNEITQLKSEITRMQSPAMVQPSWISQMESTLAVYFDRQLKKLDEINSPSRIQQTVSKLQSTIRSEFENKAHTLEQRSVDFIRKELQSVIATEMNKLEPVLKNTTLQLLTHLSQNKAIIDTYSQATSAAAVTAMNRACKDTIAQHLLPSLERSFHSLFTQLHDTFAKGIAEFVRNIESNLERHRRLQDKESVVQLNATMDKMTVVLDQVRQSIANDTKMELRRITHEFPDKVRILLSPVIQSELQQAIKNQKLAIDGALLAVQQAAHIQSRSVTPAVVELTPEDLQNQLKQMIHEGRLCEAFQRALSMSNLQMVLYVCSRVDAQQLFSRTPCIFPQPVLLSLIQQLSADLGTQTELKLEYLQEAVMAVDFRDPTIREHSPKVMPLLVSQLQAQVNNHPGGPLTRQLRLLLLAAQPLAKNV